MGADVLGGVTGNRIAPRTVGIAMDQSIFNWLIGIVCTIGGWWMKAMWGEVKDLKHQDKELADRVAAIDVLVAGSYVKRDAFEIRITDLAAAIFKKLDRIEDKLDGKVDKLPGN